MADKTIAIYCFFDDLFKVMGPKTDPHCKLNDAEIATIAAMAAISFYGNQTAACGYIQQHYGMNMIDKSGFNRRLSYTDYEQEDFYAECDQIYLIIVHFDINV